MTDDEMSILWKEMQTLKTTVEWLNTRLDLARISGTRETRNKYLSESYLRLTTAQKSLREITEMLMGHDASLLHGIS